MPEWLLIPGMLPGLLTLAAGVIASGAAVLGYLLAAKTTRSAAATQAAAQVEASRASVVVAEKSNEQALIDQLQEELKTHREAQAARATAQDARMTAQDERMERLEKLSDGYRDYAHVLRSHIFDRKAPPPPEWPDGLPR